MIIQNILTRLIFLRSLFFVIHADAYLAEQFQQSGYAQVDYALFATNLDDATVTCAHLYQSFDELIVFLQTNPAWAQKLYCAKERFLRSKWKDLYSTDFFGLYDESERKGRHQISFYYSVHFHDFLEMYYPDIMQVPTIAQFLAMCRIIQQPCTALFSWVQDDLQYHDHHLSVLLKVMKYFPDYAPVKPHYDGSVVTCFLDSTDTHSLLVARYGTSLTPGNFIIPNRALFAKTMLVIPGAFLSKPDLYPTPHIVVYSGQTRYATIAFGMPDNYKSTKQQWASLPDFSIE